MLLGLRQLDTAPSRQQWIVSAGISVKTTPASGEKFPVGGKVL